MPFRVSFFFAQQADLLGGYSENYYNNLTDIAAVSAAAVNLRQKLRIFKGFGISAPSIRISDLANFRKVTPLRYPNSGTTPQGSGFDADYVDTAALLVLSGPANYITRQWIRSIPDGDVNMAGRWLPSATTISNLASLRGELINGSEGWVIRSQDKAQVKKDITNVTLAGVVTVTGHGYASGNKVRISRTGGIPGLNRIWKIVVIDSNTFQLVAIPLGGFSGGYTKPGTAQLQAAIYQAIQDVKVDRATKHNTGRPFGQLSGRRKRRTP